jgi:hypothetical protein
LCSRMFTPSRLTMTRWRWICKPIRDWPLTMTTAKIYKPPGCRAEVGHEDRFYKLTVSFRRLGDASHCASFKQRSRFGEVPFRSDIFPSNSVPVRRKAQRGTGGNSEGRQRVQARKCSPAPVSDLHRLAIHSTRIFLCGSFLFTSRSIRRSHGQASCGPKVKILSRSSHFGYTDCEHTGD